MKKPDTCIGCELYETGKGFVPDETVPNPEVTIVAEAPGKTEIEQGKPLVGQAGFVLKNWGMRTVPTLQLLYEKKKISLCNILKCQPPDFHGRPYPTGETREQAEAHCKQYLDIGNPKVVILCGETPQRYYFGKELSEEDSTDRSLGREIKGVMGRIGRVIERDGIRYVFAPHPAFVLRQPALVSHLQEALKIAAGQEKYMEPELIIWEQALTELINQDNEPGSEA